MAADRSGLAELLVVYRQQVLVRFLDRHGLLAEQERPSKDDAAARLAAHFASSAGIQARLAGLDATARTAFDLVHRAWGRISRQVLIEVLVEDGLATPPAMTKPRYSYERPQPAPGSPDTPDSRAAQDVLARLEAAGLVLGSGPQGTSTVVDPGAAQTYVIPAEVWEELPEPPPWPALPVPPLDRELSGDPQAMSRGLFFLWSHLDRQRPVLLMSGLLGKRELKPAAQALGLEAQVAEAKDETDLAPLYLARRMLESLALLSGTAGQPLTGHNDLTRDFWSMPLAERLLYLVDAYIGLPGFNELRYLPQTKWVPSTRAELTELPSTLGPARDQVLWSLVEVAESGAWVAVATVLRALRLMNRDFLVKAAPPSRSPYNYWGAAARHRYESGGNPRGWGFSGIKDETDGWQRVEGGFLAVVLDSLHRMGVIDLGLGSKGEILALRLNPWGRYALLETAAAPEETEEGARLVVQPNFHVVALGPVPELKLLDLEAFADRASADRAVTYVLSRESVYRGQQMGWDGPRILSWLTEATGTELPQNVGRSLSEWQDLHGRIVIKTGVHLLQVREPALLDRLAGEVRQLRRVTPTLALVPELATAAVDRALVAADEMARHLPAGGDPVPTLNLAEEGDPVALRHRFVDYHTLGWLQRLAEADGEAWRLSAAAARRARERLGLSAEDQLARWTALCGQPPPWLAPRLKAWTGHYGAAKRLRGVILELPSAEVLKDLRQHKDLQSGLRPLDSKGPLVAIDAASYPRIAERLRELGLDVPPEGGEDEG